MSINVTKITSAMRDSNWKCSKYIKSQFSLHNQQMQRLYNLSPAPFWCKSGSYLTVFTCSCACACVL